MLLSSLNSVSRLFECPSLLRSGVMATSIALAVRLTTVTGAEKVKVRSMHESVERICACVLRGTPLELTFTLQYTAAAVAVSAEQRSLLA